MAWPLHKTRFLGAGIEAGAVLAGFRAPARPKDAPAPRKRPAVIADRPTGFLGAGIETGAIVAGFPALAQPKTNLHPENA
jgi:hypothetical protein